MEQHFPSSPQDIIRNTLYIKVCVSGLRSAGGRGIPKNRLAAVTRTVDTGNWHNVR